MSWGKTWHDARPSIHARHIQLYKQGLLQAEGHARQLKCIADLQQSVQRVPDCDCSVFFAEEAFISLTISS